MKKETACFLIVIYLFIYLYELDGAENFGLSVSASVPAVWTNRRNARVRKAEIIS